jgi:CBS domain-containing membrane protein
MTTVSDLMSSEVVTLERNETLDLADRIMSLGRIRHMPVLDEDGQLCGVVSQRDLFRGALATALGYGVVAQNKLLAALQVKEVMTTELLTATPDMPIAEAARVMLRHKVGCLPVLDGERLVGLITEADFVKHVAALSSG